MKTLPPLEFTLDGPGLTLEQIGAALKHQQERRAGTAMRAALREVRIEPTRRDQSPRRGESE